MQTSFKNALFISDIHLTEDRPDCIRAFFEFLKWIPETVDSLFILGDFFEYWVGDDVMTPLAGKVSDELAAISDSKKIKIFLVPGNRDFSIGQQFAQRSKLELLGDETLFSIAGKKVCVTHGDQYCTDDVKYQIFRKIIRNKFVLKFLLSLAKEKRIKIAEKLRANSKARFTKKPVYIDVTPQAIANAFRRTNSEIIVHGHTHMADIHIIDSLKNPPEIRIVLGDWHQVGWYGQIDDQGHSLTQFSINEPVF